MKTFSDKKAVNQPTAMVASANRCQQYQPTDRQRHKACKGKALNQITKMMGREVRHMELNKVEASRWYVGIVEKMDTQKECVHL